MSGARGAKQKSIETAYCDVTFFNADITFFYYFIIISETIFTGRRNEGGGINDSFDGGCVWGDDVGFYATCFSYFTSHHLSSPLFTSLHLSSPLIISLHLSSPLFTSHHLSSSLFP